MSSKGSSGRWGAVLGLVGSVPWRPILRDLLVVAIWVAGVSVVFRAVGWPTWQYYLVVFGGVITYSRMGDSWPSRSGA